MLLPLTLFFLSWTSVVNAGGVHLGEPCKIASSRLQAGTYQFYSECDSQTWCSNGKCQSRNCRRDDFPFGYGQDSKAIPKKCPKGEFCPDEEDECQPLLAVGSPCQLNRDDECEAPPNFKELVDQERRGRNHNGSVCLNNICMWANVTVGQTCIVENTAYIGYSADGETAEFIDIVSRGNCRIGSYCDASQKICMKNKDFGQACGADKECESYNCLESGICGFSADLPNHFPAWVYGLVAIGIIAGMIGTLSGMYFLHRRQRDREREKRLQYWREQNAFRQNILQMRDTATLILSQTSGQVSRRSSTIGGQSVDSHAPMLQHAANKGSGLRHYMYDDASDFDDGMSMQEPMSVERRADGRF